MTVPEKSQVLSFQQSRNAGRRLSILPCARVIYGRQSSLRFVAGGYPKEPSHTPPQSDSIKATAARPCLEALSC
eukprot:scaffold103135_cov54-Prasinocladus_malaysianus.AAC.1